MTSKAFELAKLGNVVSDGALSNRNLLINGNMEVSQRGFTTFTATGANYSVDRWLFAKNDSVNYDAVIADFPIGQTDVPRGKKYIQFTLNSAGSGSDFVRFEQRIEDVTTAAGQTVTLSFWAKADTTFTADCDGLANEAVVGMMQYFGTGGTPSSVTNTAFTNSITLTPTWTKYTYTATLPSVSGKTIGTNGNDHLRLYLLGLMDDDAGRTVSLAQVQLEVGDTATPFEFRSYGQELILCQRYFQKLINAADTSNSDAQIGIGMGWSGAQIEMGIRYIVEMRAQPSLTFYSAGGAYQARSENATINIANWFLYRPSTREGLLYKPGISGVTEGAAYRVCTNTLSAYINLDAEL